MIRFLTRYRKPIFIGTVTIFLLGIFVGLGGYLLTDADVSGAVAEVGGEKVPRDRFEIQARNILERLRERGQETGKETEERVRQEVLRDLIVESLFARQGERMGLQVTDREVAADIQETFRSEKGFDPRLYFQAVQSQFRMTPEQYEAMRRRALLAFKYRQFLQRAAKVTPEEVRAAWVREHGGLKGFQEKRTEAMLALHQRRSLELLNFVLRQAAASTEIKTYPLQP